MQSSYYWLCAFLWQPSPSCREDVRISACHKDAPCINPAYFYCHLASENSSHRNVLSTHPQDQHRCNTWLMAMKTWYVARDAYETIMWSIIQSAWCSLIWLGNEWIMKSDRHRIYVLQMRDPVWYQLRNLRSQKKKNRHDVPFLIITRRPVSLRRQLFRFL